MTILVRPEILLSLNSVREDVQRQVASLDRFRALKAIEQTIADFPALEDLTRSLSDIRERMQRQLDDTREYRALQTIERIMPELSEVFALLEERATNEESVSSAIAEDGAANEQDFTEDRDAGSLPEPVTVAASEFEAAACVVIAEPESGAEQAYRAQAYRDADVAEPAIKPVSTGFEPGYEPHSPKPELQPDSPPEIGAVPSLAASVAQLMAQSVAPPPRDHAASQPHQERSDTVAPAAERAA
jgi:hypothetical protein